MLAIVRAAFAARPPLDPPADALGETVESLAAALAPRRPGRRAATAATSVRCVLDPEGATLWLRRVGVLPDVREHGVATALVAEALAGAEGYDDVAVLAREELPGTVDVLARARLRRDRRALAVRRAARGRAPTAYDAPDAEAMRGARRRRWPACCGPATSWCSSGELGRARRRFTQGLGAGLGVRGDVTSPTFVIARVHPSLGGRPGAGPRRRLPPRRASPSSTTSTSTPPSTRR